MGRNGDPLVDLDIAHQPMGADPCSRGLDSIPNRSDAVSRCHDADCDEEGGEDRGGRGAGADQAGKRAESWEREVEQTIAGIFHVSVSLGR